MGHQSGNVFLNGSAGGKKLFVLNLYKIISKLKLFLALTNKKE